MCRLLGIYGQVDVWKEVALNFRELAEHGMVPPICAEPGHKDGWGMAGSDRKHASMVEIKRQLGAANESALYDHAIQSIESQPHIFICHIRKASPGIPVTIGNVHPFFQQGWAFIHNGTIYNYDRIPQNPAFEMTSDGSDSEYFFSYLLGRLQTAGDGSGLLKGLGEAMASLKLSYTSLNCILCNGSELFAIRDYMRFGEYLSLFYYCLPKGIVICSERLEVNGLDHEKWQMMPNKSILRIYGSPPSLDLFAFNAFR